MDVRPPSSDLADHLIAVHRRWWLVTGLVILGIVLAAGVTARLPRTYRSTTSVLVLPAGQDANAVGGRTKSDINLDTEAQLVTSTAVAARAATLLHSHAAPDDLAGSVTVAVPPNSTVLQIAYAARRPADAKAGSHAFATAYLANRSAAAASANNQAAKQLDDQIAAVTTKLQATTTAIGKLHSGSSRRSFLDSQRRSLSNQLDTLTTRRSAVGDTDADTGRIISDAALPTAPTSPSVPINLGAGALVGLIVGLAAALLLARFARRVRYADDLPRHAGVAVLATLPETVDALLAGDSAGGRVFSRLRNELAAHRGDDDATGTDETGRRASGAPAMIVVTGVSAGATGIVVATNLAAAFARSGAATILIDAAGSTAVRRPIDGAALTGVPATPGWSDALAGETDEPAHATPAEPHLSVVPAGSPDAGAPAVATGPVPAETARIVLAALQERAAHVIVAAPDTTSGADAQTLAALADAALLVVELKATTREAITDAAEQLHRVGTPLLGAILVPPPHAAPATPTRRRARPTLPVQSPGPDPVSTDLPTDEDPVGTDGARKDQVDRDRDDEGTADAAGDATAPAETAGDATAPAETAETTEAAETDAAAEERAASGPLTDRVGGPAMTDDDPARPEATDEDPSAAPEPATDDAAPATDATEPVAGADAAGTDATGERSDEGAGSGADGDDTRDDVAADAGETSVVDGAPAAAGATGGRS